MNSLYEYRSELDQLNFTSEQKALLTAGIRENAAAKTPAAHRPLRRTAILAVTAAVILTAGGAVFASGQTGKLFAPVFGTAQTEVIDKIGLPVGAGATSSGITVTADAIIGDKYSACIIYTVKRADGSALGLPSGVSAEDLSFAQADCGLSGIDGSYGSSWFTDGESDGTARFVENISSAGALKRGQAHADFRGLRYCDPVSGKMVALSDGEWKFDFSVDYEDSSVSLPAEETFSHNGIHFTITEISISPVAAHVVYRADSRADWGKEAADGREPSQAAGESDRFLGNVSVILTKKDGSTLDLTGSGGSIQASGDKTVCTKSGMFKEIIPLKDMESITIGGVQIPIHSD